MSVTLITGTTGAGKTVLGTKLVVGLAREISRPIFLVDMEGVTDIDGIETVSDMADACEKYFEEGVSVRWIPDDPEEVARLAIVIALMQRNPAAGPMILMIEEAADVVRHDAISKPVKKLLRLHRHLRLRLFILSQYVGDFAPSVLQMADDVYAFNSPSARAQERLEKEYRLTDLEDLAVGEFKEWHKGMKPAK